MRMRNVILTLVLALSLGLTACEFGQVEQGRCVAFNPETKTLLVVLDVNHDQLNPHYSGGIHEYTLPADPSEIGPLPVPGGRVMFDLEKSTVTIFNPETKALEVLNVNFTDVEKGIKRTHPKVHGKTFPIIDKDKMSVTLCTAPRFPAVLHKRTAYRTLPNTHAFSTPLQNSAGFLPAFSVTCAAGNAFRICSARMPAAKRSVP